MTTGQGQGTFRRGAARRPSQNAPFGPEVNPAISMSHDTLEQIRELAARWRNSAPTGGAIALVEHGETVALTTFGLADLERGLSFDADTPFHICSLTKQFTACVLLMLERDGKIDLDRDVRVYLPELPDFQATVTVRHLLTNTSGLKDYLVLPGIADGVAANPLTEIDALALVLGQTRLMYEPGSRYSYSNTNFLLAGRLIERLTGAALADVFAERLFVPLDLGATRFLSRTLPPPHEAAVGYLQTPEGTLSAPRLDIYEAGDGGVWSTIQDLARWEAHWHNRTLGEELHTRMTQPPMLSGGTRSWYAYGLGVGTFRGERWSGHSGGLSGMSLSRVLFPDRALSVVVVANGPGVEPESLCMEIAGLRLPAAPAAVTAPTPDIDAWNSRVGIYSHQQGAQVLAVETADGAAQRVMVRWQSVRVPMTAEVGGVLQDDSGLWRVRPAGDDGRALELSTRQGPWLRFDRQSAAPAQPVVIDGAWRCAALASLWVVRTTADEPSLEIRGPRARTLGLSLRPLARDLYSVIRNDGIASGITACFTRAGGGRGEAPDTLIVSVPSSAGHEFRYIGPSEDNQ